MNVTELTNETGKKPLFLIVEDSVDHATIIEYLMKVSGVALRTMVFECAESAETFLLELEQGAEHNIVVFLDLNLPGISGIDFLKWVRLNQRLKDIPVVILSTSNAPEDIKLAVEAGSNSYLSKPSDFETFRTLLRDASVYWGTWNQTPGEAR